MSRDVYVKGAVLVLAVLVLAVEGYFGYRWYQRYYVDSASVRAAASSASRGGGATGGGTDSSAGEATSRERAGGAVALVHRAAPETIEDNSTYIDHPAANGNPDAVLMVTQVWNPDGAADNTHPTGVWYDENRGGRWAIFNQDLAPMPEGAVFNVIVLEKPGEDAFVHRAAPEDTVGESTYVDHPSANAAPGAVLTVTPSWNPGGEAGTYDDHPVSVWYDAGEERWAIRNEDLAPMPDGAAFNVSVQSSGAG